MDYPQLPHGAWSIKWLCGTCGEAYAHMRAYEGESLRPYKFRIGCCRACPPTPYAIQGSVEALELVGWPVPLPIALYQLNSELDYLAHPSHPHNLD